MSNLFNDRPVLLKMYRRYAQHETMKFLFDEIISMDKEISDLKFKIGEQRSEIAELHYQKTQPGAEELKSVKQWKKDDALKLIVEENKRMHKQLSKLSKDIEVWQNKYFNLTARLMKLELSHLINESNPILSTGTSIDETGRGK